MESQATSDHEQFRNQKDNAPDYAGDPEYSRKISETETSKTNATKVQRRHPQLKHVLGFVQFCNKLESGDFRWALFSCNSRFEFNDNYISAVELLRKDSGRRRKSSALTWMNS